MGIIGLDSLTIESRARPWDKLQRLIGKPKVWGSGCPGALKKSLAIGSIIQEKLRNTMVFMS